MQDFGIDTGRIDSILDKASSKIPFFESEFFTEFGFPSIRQTWLAERPDMVRSVKDRFAPSGGENFVGGFDPELEICAVKYR